MVFDFLKGEFIDVISWLDDTRDTMVWRFDRHGQAIKYGAKLTVREGQAAVFIHEGQLADVFGPGLYMLETNNMPILTTLQHWDHGFQSPVQVRGLFRQHHPLQRPEMGHQEPDHARDPEFGPVRLRAFGTYSMRVTDPGKFMTEIVGTDGEFTSDEISFQIRNVIVQEVSRCWPSRASRCWTWRRTPPTWASSSPGHRAAGRRIRAVDAGILHREHQPAGRGRKGAGQAHLDGDRGRSEQVHAVQRGRGAWPTQPGRHGAAMGAGMGMGMGMGMAQNRGPWGRSGAAPAAPPPPPPPRRARSGTRAENGATSGPFTEADLGRMARRAG
jgi:hypothetical protein